MAKQKKTGRRILGGIILVLGLIFTLIGASLSFGAYGFSQRAIANSGVVTSVETIWSNSSRSNSSGPTYKPTIRYIDQKGTPQSGQTFLSSSRYNYPLGTKIRILYDPQNPGDIRMDNWFSLWGFNLVFLVVGLLISAGGIAILRSGPPKSAPPKTAEAKAPSEKFSYSSNEAPKSQTVRRK